MEMEYKKYGYFETAVATYDGIEDYMETGRKWLSHNNAVMRRQKLACDVSGPSFCRFCGGSYQDLQARKLPESLNLADFSAGISANLSESQQDTDFSYDVSGLTYDCGMYSSGRPDIWLNSAGDEKPAVNMVILNSIPHYTSAASVAREAQGKLAVVLHFLKNEYRINLYYANQGGCKAHKIKTHDIDFFLELVNMGAAQDIAIETFAFVFGTSLFYRAESVMAHDTFLANSTKGGHVTGNTLNIESQLHDMQLDGCNVILAPGMDYAPEKVDKWLSENEIEAGKTLVYREC